MKEWQWLLIKLAEEAAELSQIALKTAHFGIEEQQPENPLTNIQRVNEEFNDILAVVDRWNEYLSYQGMNVLVKDDDLVNKKLAKMDKYLKYSQELGLVEKDGVVSE